MWWFISSIFLFSLIFETNAQFGNENEEKPATKQKIDSIKNKIDKIANDILAGSSSKNREHIIRNVEKKLLKAAEHLGDKGKSHVKLIMEGIKFKIFNKDKFIEESANVENNVTTNSNNESFKSERLIIDLSNKIEFLIRNEIGKLKTTQGEPELLNDIKRRVLESVQEKLDEVLGISNINVSNKTRRMNLKIDESFRNRMHNNVELNDAVDSRTTLKRFIVNPVCDNVYDQACSDIKNMNRLKCLYDDVFVSLEKLCDGNADCPDKHDEKYCGSQAMEKMEFSNQVIINIETYFQNNCFAKEEMQSVLSKQSFVLRDVLQSQLDFKEQYRNFSIDMNNLANKKYSDSEATIKRRANEIAIIISSVSLSLDSALCSRRSESFLTHRRANVFDVDLDQMLKELIWPPKCNCNRQHCFNCPDICKLVCWHKFSLTKWKCDSINASGTVSLDSLCDGKLDCFDESDERGCETATGYAKFEAREMYSNIINMLNLKASKEIPPVQKNIYLLSNLIQKLQKITAKTVPNIEVIKKLRDKCYFLLKDIYTDVLRHSSATDTIEDAYIFLNAVNQNLGFALKRSHAGNKRIIPHGCYCRDSRCGSHFCSKICIKACSVETKLMRYSCGRGSNVTVSIDKVCNGKKDCPGGYDEFDCKKQEICRRHHLVMLRSNLKDVGENLRGTSLGEHLISWKTKVFSTLKVAEKDSRPKPKILKNIVKDILRDLLVTYGSLENYRRTSTDYALPEFMIISQIIIESLKSCGK